MKKYTRREKFQYWFDNQMSKGSISLIRLLIIFTVLTVLLVSAVIMLAGANGEESWAGVLWNSIATIINAWMPSFDEGSPGYLLLMALTAFAGLLVTSVLIGIFTSTIEEKISSLRRGNSPVIEEGHTVLLGFYPGEYTLIRQLILAAAGKPRTIVIGAEMERDELEQYIKDNVEVPSNIRIICRTIDLLDPMSIDRLSIGTCRNILVSPTDDNTTIKILLAVSALMTRADCRDTRVNAITGKEENRFPPALAREHNVITLQSNDTMAKIIAHSCTQTGLSEVFREVFNFEGSELYLVKMKGQEGLTFKELLRRTDGGVPVGIFHDYEIIMNPPSDMTVTEDDSVLVFAQSSDSSYLKEDTGDVLPDLGLMPGKPERNTKVLIFGNKSTLKVILRELPENVEKVTLVNYDKYRYDLIKKICEERDIQLELVEGDVRNEMKLLEIARNAEHVIIQSNYGDEEEADMNTIFLLLNLREIRMKYHLRFNITAEMRRERNQNLAGDGDHTDFIVASNMSSLFLAQLAESPQLLSAFRELLSNQGNELFMKRASNLHIGGKYTVMELRALLHRQGYVFLGCRNNNGMYKFNPPLEEELNVLETDSLIVFGEH